MSRFVDVKCDEVQHILCGYTSRKGGFGLAPGKTTVEIRAPGVVISFTGTLAEMAHFKTKLIEAMERETWKGGSG